MIQIPIDKLRENLVSTGLVQEPDFDKALSDSKRTGQQLSDILISRRLMGSSYYLNLISEYYDIPRASIAANPISTEVLHVLPEKLARQKRAVVFSKEEDGTYNVGMEDPNDLSTIEFLEKYLSGKIKPFISDEQFLNKGFTLYSQESTQNFISVIEANVKESERLKIAGKELEEAAVDVPIISIVDNLMAYSNAMGTSDIHIETLEEMVVVRFRIDGILREVLQLPLSVHQAIVARVKLLSSLRIDEHGRPQDGRFRYGSAGRFMDIRVAIMPTFHGEKVVMRLLRATTKPLSFADLGMLPDTEKSIRNALERTYGIILITGPTGSGKTTTIYSMIDLINKPEVNIVTIEDPIEYNMRHVNQTQVNNTAGITFSNALRAFLRQDPNVILVGEIRDSETANIAVNAALTGHLVVASLHTNDAPTAIPRLIDMDVPPFLVAAVMNIVLAQRLIRRVCIECVESYAPSKEVIQIVEEQVQLMGSEFHPPSAFFRGKGCFACGNMGYRGRMAIYEVAEIDGEVRNLVSNKDFTLDSMKDLLKRKKMKMMFEDGLLKVQQGLTTIEELLRVVRE